MPMASVTQILGQIESGDPAAAEELLPLVYDQLRKLAAQRLAHEKPGQTLQATALVHEAYIRLVDVKKAQHFNGRGHFFASAAEGMRRILVEQARRKGTLKAGGGHRRVALSDVDCQIDDSNVDLLALDEILGLLESRDPESAKLVKLRYFAGLTMAQAAEAMSLPLRSAERNWTYVRTWLHRELSKRDRGTRG